MSAENAWRIAMEAGAKLASEQAQNLGPRYYDGEPARACEDVAECIRSLPMPPAFRAEAEAEAERMKLAIAKRLDEEAEMTPCEEDAGVIRGCARLVRVDFSYDAADALEAIKSVDANASGSADLRAQLAKMAAERDAAIDWAEKAERDFTAKRRAEELRGMLAELIGEVLEHCDGRQDVNWEGGGPNAEMRLGNTAREMEARLARLEAKGESHE